jgi:phosphate transport system substrate-binding protein
MKKTCVFFTILAITLGFSSPGIAEEIAIVGSGVGTTVIEALGAAFNQNNPEVTITVPPSIGSGGGIKAVGTDKNIVGRVARPPKESEQGYGLTYVLVAKIPVVFFVHTGVSITDISTQQILDIYSGKMTNWEEAGGNNLRIRVVVRQESSSSFKLLLESFPGFKDITITPKSKTTYSTPEALSLLESKPGTIVFGAYDVAKAGQVKVLTIDGKSPTDPDYPYFVTSGIVFKEEQNTGDLKNFVDFVTSEDAHEIIKEAGGLPPQ